MQTTPRPPAELGLAAWERGAGPLAKARPTDVGDALKALQKAFDAVDFALFDAATLATAAAAEQRLTQARSEAEKRVRALADCTGAAGGAAGKWEQRSRKTAPKPALAAAAAIERAAGSYATALEAHVKAALAALEKRRDELQAEEEAAQSQDQAPVETPERRRLRARVIDMFRIVKNRPDRRVLFLLCVGHRSCVPYLAPAVSDAQKPLLLKALKGDTGMRFFRGECIWEDGGYTFVGTRMTTTLARRIERGLLELTNTRWRIRAREGDASGAGDDDEKGGKKNVA